MTSKKKDLISDENKKEIFYNLVNSFLAGALVFLGALSTGNFNSLSCFIAFITSLIVALTKFRDYWDGEKTEYCSKLLTFY